MDRYGQPTQCQLHGHVSAHMQIIVKNIWHEKLSSHGERERAKTFGSRHLRGYFLAVGKNGSLPEKCFFLGLFSRLNGNGLKRSCSHACGREEGPKEPRIGPRTGCETCQVGAFRRHRVARPRAQPQPRPNPSPGQPAQREIRRHYYLEARGLSLSGQRVSLQARRV